MIFLGCYLNGDNQNFLEYDMNAASDKQQPGAAWDCGQGSEGSWGYNSSSSTLMWWGGGGGLVITSVWRGLPPRWQSACWERRHAEQLNYLVVRRDPSAKAKRREHFVTERKKKVVSVKVKMEKKGWGVWLACCQQVLTSSAISTQSKNMRGDWLWEGLKLEVISSCSARTQEKWKIEILWNQVFAGVFLASGQITEPFNLKNWSYEVKCPINCWHSLKLFYHSLELKYDLAHT